MDNRSRGAALAASLALLAAACRHDPRGGELHAKKVVLAREVEGLRAQTEKLSRGESILPPDDVIVGVQDSLVRDLLAANLPFEAAVEKYQIRLLQAEVTFRGSPLISLTGTAAPKDNAEVQGEVRVLGALDKIRVDPVSGLLSASVAVDHVDIKRLAGFESFLPGAGLDELARTVRLQLTDKIPDLAIPVKVEQKIDFPALTSGPVRLDGATLPLAINISDVIASNGSLWVSIAIKPGDVAETGRTPSAEATAAPAPTKAPAAKKKATATAKPGPSK
ncbi:MAG TPA: hypothetical protein VFQ51_16305 [Vicinamibacteria bacterium]|nr:hypothetical protein [Vicinamibacteria bacterium]